MITLFANSLCTRILLGCFFCFIHQFISMFSVAKKISCCNHLWIFMIYPFYVVNSTTVLHHYLLFFLNHFTRFSAYINHIFIVYSTEVSGFFISSFISLNSLNTIVTKINLWCLIYESIKALEIKTSNVFNLAFANKTIWHGFSSFSWQLTYTF